MGAVIQQQKDNQEPKPVSCFYFKETSKRRTLLSEEFKLFCQFQIYQLICPIRDHGANKPNHK